MFTTSSRPATRVSAGFRRLATATGIATTSLVLAATGVLMAPAATATTSTTGTLIGHLDMATTSSGGAIGVTGWVADRAAPSTPLHVSIVLTDSRGTVTVTQWLANQARSDVASAYPALGPSHGYAVPLYVSPGTYRVCAAARSVNGVYGLSECLPATVPVDHLPIGHLDAVRTLTANHLQIAGWALDPDTLTTPDRVTITLGGTFYSAFKTLTVSADQLRPDVAQAVPGAGPSHGFNVTVATLPGTYPICAYGINNYIYGAPKLLGCLTANG